MRHRWKRLPLTAVYGASSLAVVALVAAAIGSVLGGVIEDRAIQTTLRGAQFVSEAGLEELLIDGVARGELTEAEIDEVDAAVMHGIEAGVMTKLKVFDREGMIVYSSDHGLIGKGAFSSPRLRTVLETNTPVHAVPDITDAEHVRESDLGPQMEAFIPLHHHEGDPVGVAELYVSLQPVLDAAAEDKRQLYGVLGVGLVFLWLTLFRLVVVASRRLTAEVRQNEHQALHDALTGLPNRTLLFDRVERALAAGRRTGAQSAVLLLDLDRFKEVNDTLGHHNGDELLRQVAARFATVLREADTIARLGGDEFAVLLPVVGDAGEAITVAGRLVAALDQPFDLDGLNVSVGASVGAALAPGHGDTAEVLLQRADVAMYLAKKGSAGVALYSSDADHYSPERLALLGDMRHALEREELVLHFQPKADARTGQVRGLEALLRWEHPERGRIMPDVFIPLVEHTGMIDAMTLYVIERALRECEGWAAAGHEVSVAVNVSVRNVIDREFPARVAELLEASSVPPERLVLELTESALMTDPDAALDVLVQLKAMGVALSVDDYGSGYSSLAYLQRLPMDELKIDRQFVRSLAQRQTDHVIVRSTVDLAKNLGLRVVAEGVEDEEAWHTLADLSCDAIQGYFLSRPMAAGDVLGWLGAHAEGPPRSYGRGAAAPPAPPALPAPRPRSQAVLPRP